MSEQSGTDQDDGGRLPLADGHQPRESNPNRPNQRVRMLGVADGDPFSMVGTEQWLVGNGAFVVLV